MLPAHGVIRKTKVRYCRFTAAQDAKLEALCEATGRGWTEVVRALVASASVEQLPQAWRGDEAQLLRELEGR